MRLLLVEDDSMIGAGVQRALRDEGYTVDWVHDGVAAALAIADNPYAVVLLDLGLPRRDGISLLEQLRSAGNTIPVLIMTARDAVADRIRGLDAGADDYLVKPFAFRELEARIRALLRRGRLQSATGMDRGGLWTCADLTLNEEEHWAARQGRRLRLSPTGFRILKELLRVAPGLVRRQHLEQVLWGDEPPEGSALRTHIHELRRELDKPFGLPLLHTVPHVGYRLAVPDEAETSS